MILEQFWLTDAQFSKIAPHLPTAELCGNLGDDGVMKAA
jgi:hypothetical protein